MAAGAAGVAVIHSVFGAADVERAARSLRTAIDAARG
jgi:thiamine monophosphate synthase